MVIRVHTGNAQLVPGAYRTSVQAALIRENSASGVDSSLGTGTDTWEVRDRAVDSIRVTVLGTCGNLPLTKNSTRP